MTIPSFNERCNALYNTKTWPYVARCKNEAQMERFYYVQGPNQWMALCAEHYNEGVFAGVINPDEPGEQ